MAPETKYDVLKTEVFRLVNFVQQIKREIASVKHPKSSVDHFGTVSEQLDAIVRSTEDASNMIMESVETIVDNVQEVASDIEDENARQHFEAISTSCNMVFQACAFQDLTGQRISKIVKVMSKVEDTLDSLVKIVGEEGFNELPGPDPLPTDKGDGIALDGPQLAGQGVSQADVDDMFSDANKNKEVSQDDIDALFD